MTPAVAAARQSAADAVGQAAWMVYFYYTWRSDHPECRFRWWLKVYDDLLPVAQMGDDAKFAAMSYQVEYMRSQNVHLPDARDAIERYVFSRIARAHNECRMLHMVPAADDQAA